MRSALIFVKKSNANNEKPRLDFRELSQLFAAGGPVSSLSLMKMKTSLSGVRLRQLCK